MRNIAAKELKSASLPQLNGICEEIRAEILRTVSSNGGHLASNLGAVELTVALHRVFDFPRDRLVFDVGHQCYTHKLLSGRAGRFSTLRRRNGLSGFPKREESEYDSYDTGHAGTAISAALGLAKARDLKGEDHCVIALVGDGSFQNGLVYEALNSLASLNTSVLIVLNDNGMSISPTEGGMHDLLEELKGEKETDRSVRLFERFGLRYAGICNGNRLEELLPALEEAKRELDKGSVLLHVCTRKGYGNSFCENAPVETHGVGRVCMQEYSAALGEELVALAEKDERIVAVTAAMTDSLGLRAFFDRFPERAFDVGICEEHACVLASALAAGGMKPYFAIYSTFLQRAFDEIIHDVCGQKLPVVFCVDRAGITGADGETHQGVFDLSYLSLIPDLAIAIPGNIGEFRSMVRMAAKFPGPIAIRYPRGGLEGSACEIEFGKFHILHSTSSDIVVLAAGETSLALAEKVRLRSIKTGRDFTIVNVRFLKPLDREMLTALPQRHVVTIEDNVLCGGLGDAVRRFYGNCGKQIYSFGYRDEFIPHGEPRELSEEYGRSASDLETLISEIFDACR